MRQSLLALAALGLTFAAAIALPTAASGAVIVVTDPNSHVETMPDGRVVVRTGNGAGAGMSADAPAASAPAASAGGMYPEDRAGSYEPSSPSYGAYPATEWLFGYEMGTASMSMDLSTIGGPNAEGTGLGFTRLSYFYGDYVGPGSNVDFFTWSIRGEFAGTVNAGDEDPGMPAPTVTWDSSFAVPVMLELQIRVDHDLNLWFGLGVSHVESHYADADGDTRIAYSGVVLELLRVLWGTRDDAFGGSIEMVMPDTLEFTSSHTSGWQPALDEFDTPSMTALHWRLWYQCEIADGWNLLAALDADLYRINMTDSADPVQVMTEDEDLTTYAAGGRAAFSVGLTLSF